jgi:hypothetical protein
LIVELCEDAAAGAGTTTNEVYDMLSDLGYLIYTYDPESPGLKPEPKKPSYKYTNVVATKDPQRVISRLRGN